MPTRRERALSVTQLIKDNTATLRSSVEQTMREDGALPVEEAMTSMLITAVHTVALAVLATIPDDATPDEG